MKTVINNNGKMILGKFDRLSAKVEEARHFFEKGQVKESNHALHSIRSQTRRLDKSLSWYRCHTPKGRSFNEATPLEVEQFSMLNTFFGELQEQTRGELAKIEKELDRGLSSRDSFVDDYEIDVRVFFMLGEDDPNCLDDGDNFIGRLDCPIFQVEDIEDEATDDYNDLASCQDHPLHGQHHCLFFHELLSHVDPPLSLDDVLRITNVWIDIKVYHQCFRELPMIKKVIRFEENDRR